MGDVAVTGVQTCALPISGRDYSEMLALLGYQDLEQTVAELPPHDTHLLQNLEGRDPDEAATKLPYEKGYFFLRLIEETVGREPWDRSEERRVGKDGRCSRDWSSDVCSSDLRTRLLRDARPPRVSGSRANRRRASAARHASAAESRGPRSRRSGDQAAVREGLLFPAAHRRNGRPRAVGQIGRASCRERWEM